jgi:hypothetical protein
VEGFTPNSSNVSIQICICLHKLFIPVCILFAWTVDMSLYIAYMVYWYQFVVYMDRLYIVCIIYKTQFVVYYVHGLPIYVKQYLWSFNSNSKWQIGNIKKVQYWEKCSKSTGWQTVSENVDTLRQPNFVGLCSIYIYKHNSMRQHTIHYKPCKSDGGLQTKL